MYTQTPSVNQSSRLQTQPSNSLQLSALAVSLLALHRPWLPCSSPLDASKPNNGSNWQRALDRRVAYNVMGNVICTFTFNFYVCNLFLPVVSYYLCPISSQASQPSWKTHRIRKRTRMQHTHTYIGVGREGLFVVAAPPLGFGCSL